MLPALCYAAVARMEIIPGILPEWSYGQRLSGTIQRSTGAIPPEQEGGYAQSDRFASASVDTSGYVLGRGFPRETS